MPFESRDYRISILRNENLWRIPIELQLSARGHCAARN